MCVMTKIDIFSGFLGAGKTTLIKKLLTEAYKGEQVVLIENEFGEIGIDGGFLKEAGIEIREMNSGCICCSLVGDFGEALKEVIEKYHPDRIIIEPSGVGKLSDVTKAVQKVEDAVDIKLNSFTTIVDVTKCKMYMKNFGEFFSNQIEYAGTIILSRTDTEKATEEKIVTAVEIIRSLNKKAAVITTPVEKLAGEKILDIMENNRSLEKELMEEESDNSTEPDIEYHSEDEPPTNINVTIESYPPTDEAPEIDNNVSTFYAYKKETPIHFSKFSTCGSLFSANLPLLLHILETIL